MYRFFVEQPQIGEETITITGEDVNHIKNVLRMKVGETILVSDGEDREYICKISDFSNDEVQAKIQDINGETRELPTEVTLFQALPKGDKMETIIQKMVELGACEIAPVSTKRCIVKLDAKKAAAKTISSWTQGIPFTGARWRTDSVSRLWTKKANLRRFIRSLPKRRNRKALRTSPRFIAW